MGWLWASTSPAKPSSPAQDKPAAASSTKTAPSEPNVDPEVQKFLEFFSSDTGSKPEPSAASSSGKNAKSEANSESSAGSSWLPFKAARSRDNTPTHAPRRDSLSESLLPTDMSCRQAFDLAWSCNSIGGQWNAVYRHGEMRSCSDQWDDFWFCMRTKSFSDQARAEAIREHYRDREYARYHAPGRPSSEDIWQQREEKLPPGAAFSRSIDVPTVSDDEWRRQENERRREIRQGLGIQDKVES